MADEPEAVTEQTEDNAAATEAAVSDSGADKGAAATTQEASQQKADTAQAPETTDWRAGIEDKALRDVAGRFTTPADMAKAVADMRKEISTRVKVPGKDASEEDVAAFRKAMGVPESPEKYEFSLPEGKDATDADKAFQGKMAEVFHGAGLSTSQAKALNEAWNEMTAAAEAERDKAVTEAREAARKALDKEWGKDAKANGELATRAFRTFGGSDDMLGIELSDGSLLGDHPEFLKVFAKVGRRMGEGDFIGAVTDDDRTNAQSEIDEIMRKNPPGTPGYADPKVQKRLRELNEQLYGSAPIVGAGRTA